MISLEISTSLSQSWENGSGMERVGSLRENLVSPRTATLVLLLCLGIGVLFFSYFLHRSSQVLAPSERGPKLEEVQATGIPSLLRLPASLPFELSERPRLMSEETLTAELELKPGNGFLSSLSANVRGPGLENGRLFILEFETLENAMQSYLKQGLSENQWASNGAGFSKKDMFFTLSERYLQISKGWLQSPSQGLVVHQQLARNLQSEFFSFPALGEVKSFSHASLQWEAVSIEPALKLDLPALDQAFLIKSQEFKKQMAPHSLERIYRMGLFQAMRSFSRTSNHVLYHQDFGGFTLVIKNLGKALSRQEKLTLRKILRKIP